MPNWTEPAPEVDGLPEGAEPNVELCDTRKFDDDELAEVEGSASTSYLDVAATPETPDRDSGRSCRCRSEPPRRDRTEKCAS